MNYRNVLNKKYNEEIPGSGPALLHEVQCLLDITVTVEIELLNRREGFSFHKGFSFVS